MHYECYVTCVACYVRLLVDVHDMSTEAISAAVGLEHTNLRLVDRHHFDLIGPGLKIKCAKWMLSSEESVSSVDIRDHLDWLLAQLTPHAAALQTLQGRSEVTMLLDCVMFFKGGGGVPYLRPDQMVAIADLNLPLSFDFYFLRMPDEEDSEESG